MIVASGASLVRSRERIEAILPPKGRDYRLDLLRGVANWAIFLDHIPNNAVSWITQRNFGFSDAADLFVFVSGYTASLVYTRIILERGFLIGSTRIIKHAWQSTWRTCFCLCFISPRSVSRTALQQPKPGERVQRRQLHAQPGGDTLPGSLSSHSHPSIWTCCHFSSC